MMDAVLPSVRKRMLSCRVTEETFMRLREAHDAGPYYLTTQAIIERGVLLVLLEQIKLAALAAEQAKDAGR